MPLVEKFLWGAIFIMGALLGTFLLLKLINIFYYGPRSTSISRQDPNLNISTLKILQFNTSWRPNILHLHTPDFSRDRASLLLDNLPSYDIVSLNEAYSYFNSPVSSFTSSMKKRGFPYFARSPSAGIFSPHIIDGGILFFSKFPILMHDYHTFDLSGGSEEWMAKGSLYARVQTGAGTHVHFFAVNTQPDHPGKVDECRAVRFAQLREVRAQIERKASDGQPIIVIGDLNVDALAVPVKERKSTNEYNRLLETFARETYAITDALLDSANEHLPTFGIAEPKLTPKEIVGVRKRTDYILVFNREDGEYTMSGHNTKVVEFEVEGNKNFRNLSSHFGVEADILFSRREGEMV